MLFWVFFLGSVVFEEGRKQGSKEARKQRSQGGREEGAMCQCQDAHYTLFFAGEALHPSRLLKLSRSLKTTPTNRFASDWAANRFTLKNFTQKRTWTQKQLLVICFSARGRSIYIYIIYIYIYIHIVFIAGETLRPPPHPLPLFLLMVLLQRITTAKHAYIHTSIVSAHMFVGPPSVASSWEHIRTSIKILAVP